MVMSDMYFLPGSGVTLKSLIKAIHNPLERAKWDKDVEMGRIVELIHNSKGVLFHQRMKSPIQLIQRREFLEKKLKFKKKVQHITHQNEESNAPTSPHPCGHKHTRHFVYFTSVPDSMLEIENGVTRAHVIIGIHMFEKLEDGRLRFQAIVQNDFNMGTGAMAKVATVGIIKEMPKNLKKWFGCLSAHIEASKNQPIEGAKENTSQV